MEKNIYSGATIVAQEIFDEMDSVTASELLKRATHKDSPAHDCFEWDNKKAGHYYRLDQARKILRNITIVRNELPERLIHVPRVSEECTDISEGHYTTPSVLSIHKDDIERSLNEIQSNIFGLLRRLRMIELAMNQNDNRKNKLNPIVDKMEKINTEIRKINYRDQEIG